MISVWVKRSSPAINSNRDVTVQRDSPVLRLRYAVRTAALRVLLPLPHTYRLSALGSHKVPPRPRDDVERCVMSREHRAGRVHDVVPRGASRVTCAPRPGQPLPYVLRAVASVGAGATRRGAVCLCPPRVSTEWALSV